MTKAPDGAGSIRKKTVTKNGKAYTMWEGRFCVGTDPGTGKPIRKSVYGKTQAEVRKKMTAATAAVDDKSFFEPSKMTLGKWLDTWSAEYLVSVKPRTVETYKAAIENHIKPNLGAVKLSALTAVDIQRFYNNATNAATGEPLSPKSLRNVHGVLHKALEKAVSLGYINHNPANRPELPAVQQQEIKPLDTEQIKAFLGSIKGHKYESLYTVILFTGLREGEALGLSWDCVDFKAGTLTIKQQLQIISGTGGEYRLAPTKTSKWRVLTPAPFIMQLLKHQHAEQARLRLNAGTAWDNPMNLVFTNELGSHLSKNTVYKNFKQLAAAAGVPDARLHDLRHTFATMSLRNGDSIREVQDALGHSTSAFTLQVYSHTTAEMQKESANRMEQFINQVKDKQA